MVPVDTACVPPPLPLVQVVNKAARFLSMRVAQVDAPETCMSNDMPVDIAAFAIQGKVFFAMRDFNSLALPLSKWNPGFVAVVLHEVLHQYGLSMGLPDGDQYRWVEEGTVEAVTQDFSPAWIWYASHQYAWIGATYRQWTNNIRHASAKATGKGWRSTRAKRWRIKLLLTSPTERRAMVR